MADTYDYQGLLNQFQPTQADKDAARKAQLQTFFLSLLGTQKGDEFGRLGRGGLLAQEQYSRTLNDSQKAAMERMQAAGMAMQLREKGQQFQDQAQERDILKNFYAGQGATPQPQGPQGMQPPADGVGPPAMPQQQPMQQPAQQQGSPKRAQYEQAMAMADAYAKAGRGDIARKIQEHAITLLPKLKDTKTLTDRSGKRITVNLYDDGTQEVLPFGPDAEKLHFGGDGKSVEMGFDPFTGQQRSAGVPAQISPETQLRVDMEGRGQDITMRGQNMTDARQRELNAITRANAEQGKWQTNFETGLQANSATGETRPLTGDGGRAIGPKMTTEQLKGLEDVRKTSATLDSLIKTFKPEYVGVAGSMGEVADKYTSQVPILNQFKNAQVNPDRVAFRQNSATVVNNYINQITGATVGQQGETQRLMRAVPNLDDSPGMFKAKMMQMQKNLEQLPAIIANNPNLRGQQSQSAAQPRVIDFNSLPK